MVNRRKRPTKADDSFEPGSYGWHEMVHTSCMVAELFSRAIGEHQAAKHPKLKKRIKRIEYELFELYRVAATLPE